MLQYAGSIRLRFKALRWFLCSGLGPGLGCHVPDLLVGQRRQVGEDFQQVALRVKPTAAADFDDREQDGAALPGFGFADEQLGLLADGGVAGGDPHGVVVDLNATVFEIDQQHGSHREGVVDGCAHRVLWPMTSSVGQQSGELAYLYLAAATAIGILVHVALLEINAVCFDGQCQRKRHADL